MNGQVKLVSARVATEPKAASPKVNARELESVSARVKNAREDRLRRTGGIKIAAGLQEGFRTL